MECDKEELKATKEKSADELFEELGTNKTDNCDFCVYQGKIYKNGRILFNKLNKNIIFEGFNTIEIKELKAINKKCEELKWI